MFHGLGTFNSQYVFVRLINSMALGRVSEWGGI
jgi:hypothetical protein